VQLPAIAIAIAIVRFVHKAPIYADVFSIFDILPSLQLSCGRNNTKMAPANYEICTVLRYGCFLYGFSILLEGAKYGNNGEWPKQPKTAKKRSK